MNQSRVLAIAAGLGLTALIALPFWVLSQPPTEAPADHVAAPAAEAPGVGRPAPPIALQTFAGAPWKLADLRDKRAALVVFWASW